MAEPVNSLNSEVRNLLHIHHNMELKATLELLESREQHLSTQLERRQTRKAELNSEIFNLVGFFSVFQGVMLTAVSQLKSDTYSTCKTIHWPILLTCLAAVVAIVALWLKFSDRLDLDNVIVSTKTELDATERDLSSLMSQGPVYQVPEGREVPVVPRPRRHLGVIFQPLQLKRNLVIVAVLLFSAVFIMAYFAILCNSLVIHKWEGGLS